MSSKKTGLREIDGLGPKTENRLKEHCRIKTLRELAISSAPEVQSCLQNAGANVSLETVKSWIVEANTLIGSEKRNADASFEVTAEDGEESHNDPDATHNLGFPVESSGLSVDEDGWEYLGAFILAFRVRETPSQIVERSLYTYPLNVTPEGDWLSEPSEEAPSFADSHIETVFEWQANRVGPKWQAASGEPKETSVPEMEEGKFETETPADVPVENSAAPVEESPVKLQAKQIRVYQPPDNEYAMTLAAMMATEVETLQGEQPFAVEVLLSPESQQDIVKPVTCVGHFEMWNSEAGIRAYLGRTDPVKVASGSKTISLRVNNEEKLKAGTYDLSVTILVNSSPPTGQLVEYHQLKVE